MQKRKWVVLLCLLLIAGAASDRYPQQTRRIPDSITVTAPFNPQYTSNQEPQRSVDTVAALSGISKFSKTYHTNGAAQKIALIDSGIDLSHSAFQPNQDQSVKVGVYRDYTQEGALHTQAVSCYGGKVAVGGTVYHVGNIANAAQQYRMTFLDVGAIQPKLFAAGERQLAVLVTASTQAYDCVYIDTNQDCDFRDEQPLYVYAERQQSLTLRSAGCCLDLALTSMQEDGTQLQLTADTLGHGTFLSGLLAANGTAYQGLVPQAQLYVYKIFDREGQSSQALLAKAIRQAVLDGADCINLSLSIPQEEIICPQLTEALQRAKAANVPVIAAAGNYGPGKNTIAYPAREQTVIGVGSYAAPELYQLDKGVTLQQPFVNGYSGRGQSNGESGPLLVAPSGMLSTVPGWYVQSCLYDYGTSISAAITTAAVSHVQQAAEQRKLLLSTEQLKNLLAAWAQDLHFTASEQGYGALKLGRLPRKAEQIPQREGLKEETVVYTTADQLNWNFAIPQGQTRSWSVQVPRGSKSLAVTIQIAQQQPQTVKEHLVALGRCQLSLYDPSGKLMKQTPYLGASYSRELITSGKVNQPLPRAGQWEIVVTSADNLSQYNHFESRGSLLAEIK